MAVSTPAPPSWFPHPRRRWPRAAALSALLAAALAAAAFVAARAIQAPVSVTLSVVGTTDLHGYVFPRDGRGGLAVLGGYLANLRAARDADGGGVVLLDAGDTYLGGIESNMSEGAVVVDAYNALGYAAAAIGNHDLEYGAVDRWPFGAAAGDPRGALKALARQARYPMLAANLLDAATGAPVAWPNVRPSVLVTWPASARTQGRHDLRRAVAHPWPPTSAVWPPRRWWPRSSARPRRCAPRAPRWWWWWRTPAAPASTSPLPTT
ncbi:MAG: hypothetical protein R2708_24985 [Vicinamibacterales bacterium]